MPSSTLLRRCALLLATAGTCAGLAACGGGSSSDSSATGTSASATPAASSDAAKGAAKKGRLVVADAAAVTSLDPDGPSASAVDNLIAINNTYDNLVTYKHTANPADLGGGETLDAEGVAPALATSWTQTDDGATLTLRKGVMSQYGNELTAQDVVWSYERSAGLKATGAFVYNVDGGVTGVKAVSKYEVKYTTKGPAPMLLISLGQPYTKIYDATEVKKHVSGSDKWAAKWLATHAAGFGPYTAGTFTSGRSLELEPSKTYWGGAPENAISLMAIPDAANRLNALKKGDVNVALGLAPRQLQEVGSDDALHLYRVRGNSLVTLFPNSKVPQLKNVKVRQALQYATPQDQIVKQVYLGFGFPIKSVATSYSPGYTDKYWPYTYDIAKAKDLMKQAGYAAGFSTEVDYPAESNTMAALAPILQSSYAQIGIKVTLKPVPNSTLITRVFGKKDVPMFLTDAATSVIPDMGNVAALYTTGGFANVDNYSNAQFDAAAKTALSTNDEAKRMAAFDAMQKITAADSPFVAVSGLESVVATSANITGYRWYPDQSQVFSTLKVAGS
jgi:peptide/nickel transport system substrate-binding protein